MMQTTAAILTELEELGTEQNSVIYQRHGAQEPLFGVSYANLNAIKKRIKVNHDMALELWATGNHDARVLATMIVDPKQADDILLENWVHDLNNYVLSDALSGYIGKTTFAREKAEQWTQLADEWIASVGWNLMAQLAINNKSLDDAYFETYIGIIERDINYSKNRVRHSMNNALISVGMRNDELEGLAIAAAKRIGKVIVNHGQTGCKTPDAIPYIKKGAARRRKKKR